LPAIPANQITFGADCNLTDQWTAGATVIAATGALLSGNEANLTPPLPGYFVVNLRTTYQLTARVQLFALAQNVTDARYCLSARSR
jgi:iron complex outermembrane recepter protein